jgi:Tfp pilus assembly protein PilF
VSSADRELDDRVHAVTNDSSDADAFLDEDTPVESDPLFAALMAQVARTPTLLSSTTLGRYRIDDVLGAGGMGVVYAAHDTTLSRDVALKVLKVPDVDRVLHEARAVAALHHEGVCAVWDSGVIDETPFLALERLTGETLRARLARGPLDDQNAHTILLQIARALAHAHARGVAHGDLKPENVMVTADGRAKLLDLGIARRDSDDGGLRGGTPGYLPPEDPRGEARRARANDVYAFGVVTGELLTGTRGTLLQGVARRWRPLVDGCLHRDPARRFPDGDALVHALETMTTSRARARAVGIAAAAIVIGTGLLTLVPTVVRVVAGQSALSSGASVDVGPDLASEARFRAGASALFSGDREAARAAFEEVLARGSAHPYPALLLLATDPAGEHQGSDLAHIRARTTGRSRAHEVARFVMSARGVERTTVESMAHGARTLFRRLDDDFLGRLLVATAIAPHATDDANDARARIMLRTELLDALAMRAPDVPLVALHRAWAALRLDDGARARALLAEAAVRAPGNPFVTMELAEATIASDPQHARAMLDDVITKRPSDVFARLMRVEALAAAGEVDAARADLERILDGPFADAARGRGALMFALFFSSRGYVDDARALAFRAAALLDRAGQAAQVSQAQTQIARDAHALGVDQTPLSMPHAAVDDDMHVRLVRALASDATEVTRLSLARALVDERMACVTRTFFAHLGCRSALARAALIVVEHGSATREERAAARDILALYPDDVTAPTIAKLRELLRASP